jgi:predicted nuclease with RNAse H fold
VTILTVGVDLAAQAAGTAIAAIEWGGGSARLVELQLGVDDARIVELSRGAISVGIDCALGWPIEFVEFVSAHGRHEVAPREFSGKEWRQRIRYRDTDRYVHERIGKWPLSVATDLLSLAAMHGAELLEAFEASGVVVDRAGGGMLVEVYPAASLRIWGIDVAGYKRNAASLAAAAGRVLHAAPWLTVTPAQAALMARSNDALDAVIACFTARAHSLGQTEPVPPELLAAARVEGWIALPSGDVADLIG